MFTGIVEETGFVKAIYLQGESGTIQIAASKVLQGTKLGDSIAVNGICLTVTKILADGFEADVMAETVRRSSLKAMREGSVVNLERAMACDGRFGGHIVSGHIDGVGEIVSIRPEGNAIWYQIRAKEEILRYIVSKGSIAIDGISLTVAAVEEDTFLVSVIPHTRSQTALKERSVGDVVNLENDVIGKYVERLLGLKKPAGNENAGLTYEMLEALEW
jgi:riboflavin synthase